MLDIATSLEVILTIADAHIITNIFLFLIIGFFILSLILAISGKGKSFTTYTPTLLTSLGILGTFIGIVIGLLDFDPKNIDGSITLLLSGLKTAFITSLAGMGFTILYKLLGATALFNKNATDIDNNDVEPKDILKAITHQDQYLHSIVEFMKKQDQRFNALLDGTNRQEQHFLELLQATKLQDQRFIMLIKVVAKQDQHFLSLKKAISGEEESSLTGQLKLLRSDVNDNHKNQQNNFTTFTNELRLNLKEFSEMLSKSATEQVIEALKEVITDFNKNLTEQFGDNFKALDHSVQKLVVWQTEYSKQLSHMIDQYSAGVRAIADIESSVSHINRETKHIPDTMANLKTVMEVNQQQLAELSRHLEAFKELRDQAVKAVPEMQMHVERTIDDISSASRKASENYQFLLSSTDSIQKSFVNSIESIQEQMQQSIEGLVEKQISEMNKSFNSLEKGSLSLQSNTENIQKSLSRNIEAIQETMQHSIESLVEKQISEMNKSFNSLEKGSLSLQSSTENIQKSLSSSIESVQETIQRSMESLVKKQIEETNKLCNAMEEEVSKSVDTTGKAVNKQLEMIDSSMTQEVNRVMTEMGGALGSISGQFTEDYKKLTNAMHKIVRERAGTY